MKVRYLDGIFSIQTEDLYFSVVEKLFAEDNGESLQGTHKPNGKDEKALKIACRAVYKECSHLINIMDSQKRRKNEKELAHYKRNTTYDCC